MNCVVCDKPVVGQSNVCSTSCLLKAGPPGGKGGKGKGQAAAGLLQDVFSASTTGRPDPWKDVPMIVVRHRWMKNRNQSYGTTTLSFNNEGIARVTDMGNARLDVEGYVRHSKGLAEIVEPEVLPGPPVENLVFDPDLEPELEPEPAPPPIPEEKKVVAEPPKEKEPPKEVFEEKEPPKEVPRRKIPGKKKK